MSVKFRRTELKNMPRVTIVILNYKGEGVVEHCLASVLNSNYPNFNVIFVDNASTDKSLQLVKIKFGHDPRLKIVENAKNYGPVEGNNIGIRRVDQQAKYVVLLNNDTEVDLDWLKEMVMVMESDPAIGIAGSKQHSIRDRRKLDAFGMLMDTWGFLYARGFGGREIDRGKYDNVTNIFSVGTTAMMIRKETLHKVGLLDSMYYMYYDDNDLCWRTWLSEYRVVVVPTSIVYHVGSSSIKQIPRAEVMFHNEKNRVITLIKNYNVMNLFKTLPFLLAIEFAQIGVFLFDGKISSALAILRALLWNIANFDYILNKRLEVQKLIRKVPDEEVLKHIIKPQIRLLLSRLKGLCSA